MADTLVKNPKLIVGTQAQVSAEMGQNDIGFATDVEFYTAKQIDELLSKAGGASLPILMPMWSDHLLNDVSWLRADTFSWQSGDVYVAAYEHLASELIPGEPKIETSAGEILTRNPAGDKNGYLAWVDDSGGTLYTNGEPVIGNGLFGYNSQEGTFVSAQRSIVDLVYGLKDTIGDITISYYLAQDGHKICLPDQESKVMALYEQTGVAWYYLLDTENKQFKLPRTKYGFTGLRDSVGGYVPESLPNITGAVWVRGPEYSHSASEGAFKLSASSDNYGGGHATGGASARIDLDASLSSPTYQNGAPVQQRATQMYLYYYVGNFEQSAIEQTAGLNAELFNGKADVDLSNINASQSAKEAIVGWGMPDYSAGVVVANGTHTATVDGIIVVSVVVLSGESTWNITIDNESFDFYQGYHGTDYNHITNGFLPIPKGAVYTITTTNCQARFYPLKGVN